VAELGRHEGHGDHFDAKFTVLAETFATTSKKKKMNVAKAKELKMDFDSWANNAWHAKSNRSRTAFRQ